MDLLPKPKERSFQDGAYTPGIHAMILLAPGTAPGALLYARMLQQTFADQAGLTPDIGRGAARPGDIALAVDAALPAGQYRLAIAPDTVTLTAGDDEALCNGVQTLRQIIDLNGAVLPAQTITDWPDMATRGYYFDCSRGRVPKLSYLKQVADRLCRYKVNQWQLYIEHTYLFRDLSEAWRDDTPLTAQEILELDDYCAARHIELVPSLSTFGHMYKILSTKTCCDLCELEDSEKIPFSYSYAGWHHTLNASDPDSLAFVKKLIDEYRPLFRTNKFNICDDETFDLGKGRSKEQADREGAQALYVRHVKALCEYIVAQGGIPQFWGDIMWRFPQSCAELPKETICLNWGYLPNQRENEIRDLAQMGAVQYACPGVCTWKQLVPLLRYGFSNNRVMCAHAHKYHAIGMLNTDWGDYGHLCQPAFSVPGILYGAAFAWNANGLDYEEVNRAISFLAFGDRSGRFMEAFDALSFHEVFDWFHTVRWIEAGDAAKRHAIYNDPELKLAGLAEANAQVDAALAQLREASVELDSAHRSILHDLDLAAEGVKLLNDLGCYVGAVEEGRDLPHREGPELASALESWYHAYVENWRRVSKESTLARTRKVICAWADYLRGR